ncbi:MAG TPA: hypothetical protein VF755_14795 [Catenuloplanes sp.]|jgi:hypothetical protein
MTEANPPGAEDLSRETEMEPSLRPASVEPGVDFGDDGSDDPGPSPRAGYDTDAVTGDTDAVRPQ